MLFIILIAFTQSAASALTAKEIYKHVNESTFKILAFNIMEQKPTELSIGSAVSITPNILITNCHVLSGKSYYVIKKNDKYYRGSLIYGDEKKDLCLVFFPELKFKPVKIRNIENIKVGERVYAVGSPGIYENLITSGIISGINKIDDQWLIFIDVKISPGSSGGGLFDKNAQLIGLTTSKDDHIAHAVPVNWVLKVIPSLQKAATTEKSVDSKKISELDDKPIIPIKLSAFGKDNISLYKYGKSCFILVYGRDINHNIISQMVWFPVESRTLFFSPSSQPLTHFLKEIYTLGTSKNQLQKLTKSYIMLGDKRIPMILAKGDKQEKFVLSASLNISPTVAFKKGSYFISHFVTKTPKKYRQVKFGLFGFTDSYMAYLKLCQ